MTVMLSEIKEQPGILGKLQREAEGAVAELAAKVKGRDIDLVVLAARGTSDNAAVFGKYFLEYITGLPVALAAPSLVTLYERPLRLERALVIGLSQSGEAADVGQYLAAARERGALTASITNQEGSSMAVQAENLLLCRAGKEKAVAATKTYTAEMAILAMLGLALAGDPGMTEAFRALPSRMADTLGLEEEIRAGVERYAFIQECVALARGLNLATAQEAALKIQETSYIGAKGYSAADFLHGPIAMLRHNFPCLLFAPAGASSEGLHETAVKVRDHGGELIVFTDDDRFVPLGRTSLSLPRVEEWLTPFTFITAAQIFACYLALAKGFDPDSPRGLTKVTITV